jgi:SNF2 family DNA or RNA helicase
VTVFRWVTRDTIEESIVRLHDAKRAVAESLLAGGGQAAQLETSELLDLIEGSAAR